MGDAASSWRNLAAHPASPYVLSFLLQLALAPWFVHGWDGFVFVRTAQQMLAGITPYETVEAAPSYIYLNVDWPSPNSWFAYPPGALALLLPGIAAAQAVGLTSDMALRVALKVPLILGNLALAGSVGQAVRACGGDERAAERARFLVLFNPFLWFIAAVWGMFDAWMMALLLLSFALLAKRRVVLAGLAFAAATSVKIFPLFVAPLFLVYALRAHPRPRTSALFVASAALPFALLCLPFLLRAPEGFVQQVLGMHLARPPQGFALVRLPYLPRFTSLHFGLELWPVPPGWVAPTLATSLLVPALALLYLAATRGRPTPEGLLRLALATMLAVLAAGKVVNEQYFVMPIALLAVLAVLATSGARERRAFRAWTWLGLAASAIIGFHFLTFLPREVALAWLGMSAEDAIFGIGLAVERWLGIEARRAFVLTDVVAVLLLVPVVVLSVPLLFPALRDGARGLRDELVRAPRASRRLAALLLVLVLVATPALAASAEAGKERARVDPPMPPARERQLAVTYYVWWNNPSHAPDKADGNWERLGTTPLSGFTTTNAHQMERDLSAMKEAGVDVVVASYHGYDHGRYEVLAKIARALGIRFVPMVEASVLLGDEAHRAVTPAPSRAMLRPTPAVADEIHRLALDALRLGGSEAYLRRDGEPVLFLADAHVVGPSWDEASKRVLAETLVALHNGSYDATSATLGARVATLEDVVARFPVDMAAYRADDGAARAWRSAVAARGDALLDRVRQASGIGLHLVATQPSFTTEGDDGVAVPGRIDDAFVAGVLPVYLRPPPETDDAALRAAFARQEGGVATCVYAADDTRYRGPSVGRVMSPRTLPCDARDAWLLVVPSWNMHFDGTAVEPTRERGEDGLAWLREVAKAFRGS